jgi:hypothetical protein
VEYKGRKTSWKNVNHANWTNGYIFYISRKVVVDASSYKKALGRYANDARGLHRVVGIKNNSTYEAVGDRVYIDAIRDIPAGSEILVAYGKEYWDIIRYNQQLSKKTG